MQDLKCFLIKLKEFDSSIVNFKNNKESIAKQKDDGILILFKSMLKPINTTNVFLLNQLSKEYKPYITYFNNMVFSKLKHFFFREDPNEADNDSKIDENRLTSYVRKIYLSENDARRKELLVKYFLFLFLEFDFLYSQKEKKGIFTSFKMDKKNFDMVSEFLRDNLIRIKKLDDREKGFKKFAIDLIAKVVKLYIKTDSEIPKDIFESYIESNKKILFEPFSYYIAYMAWKSAYMLQDIADGEDTQELILKYIDNMLDTIGLFSKLYTDINAQYVYIDIFNKQINNVSLIKDLLERFELPSVWHISKKPFIDTEENGLLDSLKINKFEDYSIESLIEENDENKVLNSLIFDMFESKFFQKQNISFFAAYSGGVVLSVLYKLLYPEKNIDIFLFSTFAHIDIYPAYVKYDNSFFTNIKDAENIIILDDIARTGYTFSLIESAYQTVTEKDLEAEYIVFKKSDHLEDTNINELKVHNKKDISIKLKKLSDDEKVEIDFNSKFDFNSLFLNRLYMIKIIKSMLDELDEYKNISIFYSLNGSKSLAILIGYFLANNGKQILFNKKQIEYKNILIDFTYNSGFTADIVKTNNNLKSFNKICVVKNFSDNNDIFSVF